MYFFEMFFFFSAGELEPPNISNPQLVVGWLFLKVEISPKSISSCHSKMPAFPSTKPKTTN